MSLKELALKRFYDSDSDDILRDFYIPSLSESVFYKRLTGFFSSTCLAVAAKGITRLISNGGKMKLISGAKFRREDIEAIVEAYESPERIIEKAMLEELDNLESQFVKDHVRAMGWMIAKGKLEIKIAIVYDENGYPFDERAVDDRGIFHQKVGILEDSEGNQVSFSGSDNESATGWQSNIEVFKVFRSWLETEKEYFNADLSKFERFWTDKAKRTRVIDMPRAIEKKLIEMAPANIEVLNLEKWLKGEDEWAEGFLRLWDCQKKAMNSWLANGEKGILAMATGSGKTRAALACLNKMIKQKPIVLILVPTLYLLNQWKEKIEKYFPDTDTVCCSSETEWRERLPTKLVSTEDSFFVISTMQTTCTAQFRAMWTKLVPKDRLFLIADEVHHLGAMEFGKIMSWCVPELGRIGLSATPKRAWDVAGTDKILDYFGGIVYEYGIGQAIEDGILSKYRYYPEFVSLEQDELEEYISLTSRIAKRLATLGSLHEENLITINDEQLQMLFNRRARIIKIARQKIPKALKILERETPQRCLVYCDRENQIDELATALERQGISFAVYTSQVKGRQIAIERFSKGHVDLLLAIGCLDEGIDIPWCKNALIIASSSNSAEFIQRRGRILRKHPEKKHARIFDISVLPFDLSMGPSPTIKLTNADISIIRRELNRIEIFLANADNAVEQYPKIMKVRKMFISFPRG